jgi:hypothetical protein
MFPFSTEPWPAAAAAATKEEVVVFRRQRAGDPTGSPNGESRRFVDVPPDLDEVEEDGGVDGSRAGSRVVAVGEGLEDFRRQLQPRAVEAADVAPVSIVPSAPAAILSCGGDSLVTADDERTGTGSLCGCGGGRRGFFFLSLGTSHGE